MKILSIDGGGIRGIIPAMILAKIEQKTGNPICQNFDLIAGTSTGGIIAIGVTVPHDDGKSLVYSAQEMVDLYVKEGTHIFSRSIWHTIKSLDELTGPKYQAEGIEHVLKQYFGNGIIGDAKTKIMIPAYDIEERSNFFFKNTDPNSNSFLAWQAARATSAAPTYFPPFSLPRKGSPSPYGFVDGGVFANNPAMCALVEAIKIEPESSISDHTVISIGTGNSTRPINVQTATGWGLAQWIHPLIDVMFDGISDVADIELSWLLPETKYIRIQLTISPSDQAMDDTSVTQNLVDVANKYLDSPEGIKTLEDVVKNL
jgi:patatin-like phospholipase/acyl hydrolase